jgi:hypothetical protein
MDARELIRLPDPRLNVQIEIREIVKDLRERPHVFIRVRITGWHFPHRAPEPFAVVGDVVSHHVVISRDSLLADAYFNKALPAADVLSFGWGKEISWDFPLPKRRAKMGLLDRARLPAGTVDPFKPR